MQIIKHLKNGDRNPTATICTYDYKTLIFVEPVQIEKIVRYRIDRFNNDILETGSILYNSFDIAVDQAVSDQNYVKLQQAGNIETLNPYFTKDLK